MNSRKQATYRIILILKYLLEHKALGGPSLLLIMMIMLIMLSMIIIYGYRDWTNDGFDPPSAAP